jgi:putative flippase GtrA
MVDPSGMAAIDDSRDIEASRHEPQAFRSRAGRFGDEHWDSVVIGGNAEGGSMAHMQPSAPATSNRFEKHLEGLRDHATLGRPVRFYLRRREQLLYLVVGGWNTVFGYGAWALMQYLLGDHLHYLVVVVLAWPIAVLNAYLGYRYIVFRSRGPVLRELPRFSLVYLATLVVNLALLPVALRLLPFNIYVVQALFTGVVVVCSYLGHKYFSFGGAHRRRPGDTPSHDSPAAQEN